MAFLAVLTESVFVHVLVTGIAVGISQVLESLSGIAIHNLLLVAFLTSQVFVLAEQREVGFIVVERFRILEIVKTVALRAIGGHLTLMVIVMTGQAGFVQTQIR